MQTALITTTIYVPEILRRYRTLGPDVSFFIAGDRKTPHDKVRALADELGNAVYLSDEDQEKLAYKSSEIIGWNKIMRRDIALLEAIRSGADMIVTIDDDNVPLATDYFECFERVLGKPYDGVLMSAKEGWVNAGAFLQPPVYHRGFPYEYRHMDLGVRVSGATGAKVGVAAGLWLGDPDIDAMERLTNRPLVTDVARVASDGFVVDPQNYAPFNSQNTAYLAELAPLMMVLVGVGRYDDIFASYLAERVMRESGHHLFFGPPLVYQERNEQNLWKNLRDEIFGMESTLEFIRDLDDAEVSGKDVIEDLEAIYRQLEKATYLPPVVVELGRAWCADVRRARGG